MKNLVTILFVCCCSAAFAQSSPMPVINARGNQADYSIGGAWTRGNWSISPRIARDTLTVKCFGKNERFVFKTDRDSIVLTVNPGDTHTFEVNLNDTARAVTVVHAVPMLQSLRYTQTGDEDSVRFLYGYDGGDYMTRLEASYPTASLVKGTNDLANIATLMNWTHNQWKHNGNFSPKKSDPISILDEAKAGGQFPCFAFAIVLSGKLNAAGYKTRVLYLKAKTVETDRSAPGHVVNEVYVPSLRKWVFLDPQFDALPMLNGVPLNAVEFQRAINENFNEIRFYNTVNYNGTPYTNREYYNFVYPTLYFYDFRFDNRIEPDDRSLRVKGKSNLMLVPLDASNPTKFGSFNGKINYCLYTNNVKLFYAPAE